ncbi:unnamed protein product [Trichobilharzia szidati]|nr:unnamed protein product [Trichobilharzia szidati]
MDMWDCGPLIDFISALHRNLTTRLAVACVDDTLIRSYLNSPVVRRLINVQPDVPKEWDICSDEVNVNYIRTYKDLSEQYMKLLQSSIPTLIYNGDIDVAYNYLGGEMFVDNLKLKPTLSRRYWLYTESDGTKQIGGFWKRFESHGSILTYATVRGAGNKVPGDKPAAAFQLINTFINKGSSVEQKSKKIHLISLLCILSFFISSL